jgi:hypothetical protein
LAADLTIIQLQTITVVTPDSELASRQIDIGNHSTIYNMFKFYQDKLLKRVQKDCSLTIDQLEIIGHQKVCNILDFL